MKFKTALGKAVGARLLREEPEAFQQVLGDVGKGILLAAGSHLSNELSKLSVRHDVEEVDREGDEIQPTVQHNIEEEEEEQREEVGSSREPSENDLPAAVVCPVITCTDNPRAGSGFEHHVTEKHSDISDR